MLLVFIVLPPGKLHLLDLFLQEGEKILSKRKKYDELLLEAENTIGKDRLCLATFFVRLKFPKFSILERSNAVRKMGMH